MTTQAEIEKQIDNDYGRYFQSIYDGNVAVPSQLVEWFGKAVMAISPSQLFQQKYTAKKIKELMELKVSELKIVDVGLMVNLILVTPPKEIFQDKWEAVDAMIVMDELKTEFNKGADAKKEQLQKKFVRLMELGGIVRTAKYNPTPTLEPEPENASIIMAKN